MLLDPLFRRMTLIVAILSFIGVVLGGIALFTNCWTWDHFTPPGTSVQMENGTVITEKENWVSSGLFRICPTVPNMRCVTNFQTTTFILCSVGVVSFLAAGICSVCEVFKTTDRRIVIPMLHFVACVLMTAGLFDYGSKRLLNYASSRAMLSAIVFGYVVLSMSAFIAGRYSTYDRYLHNSHVHKGQKYVPASTNGN